MRQILCYGDSNTYGYIPGTGERYPWGVRWTSILNEMLGMEDYHVIEEGLCGRTTIYEDRTRANRDGSKMLPMVLETAGEPDVVILMLGTNDAKTRFGADAKQITKGMQILVEEAKSVPCWGKGGPKILIVAPVPIEEGVTYPEFSPDCVETTKALAREYAFLAVAEQVNFLDAGGCELTKADHVHLTAKGHRQLAERMETAVREILETPEPEEIVTAKETDLPRILEIYDIAKAYMRASGNPNQWNGAYPDPETLRTDIEKQRLYVYKKNGNIHGVFMLLLEEEPTYAYIEDGSWREETPYGTIHRLAGDGEVKGLFAKCVAFCEGKVKYLRADTHFDNHTMQHLLEKNGFERRGIIYLKNGDPRIAYQK